MQLEGDVTTDSQPGAYRLALTFRLGQAGSAGGNSPRQVVLTSAARAGSRH